MKLKLVQEFDDNTNDIIDTVDTIVDKYTNHLDACIDEVKEYMKSKFPNVKNIVLCGMEVKILV